MINEKTNRHIVIDASGHLTEIARDPRAPGYKKREDVPKLKAGWRLATDEDVATAKRIESERAAKEKAEADAAAKAVKDAQAKIEALGGHSAHGPLRAKK